MNKKDTIKQCTRSAKIPSCLLDFEYFKNIHRMLTEIASEAARCEIDGIEKSENQTDIEFETQKSAIKENLKLTTLIVDSNGNSILSCSDNIFNENRFPGFLSRVHFTNSGMYNLYYNMNPKNMVELNYDFSKPKIIDFSSQSLTAEGKQSYIKIMGQNDTWVYGSYEKIYSSLQSKITKRSWLHKKIIHNVIRLLIILPIIFRLIYKIETITPNIFQNISNVMLTGIYVFIGIVFLWIYEVLFNYV